MVRLSPKCIKLFKTCNLYLGFFVQGLCVAIPGPCLLDLENLVHTSTQQIAFIYTARSLGSLSGSILGGIVLDALKSKQMIMMTACNFMVALSMLAVPWSSNLITLTGFMVVNGISLGTVSTGTNVVCLTLWGSDSGPFYQALHFSFGVGGLVAPLIAAPFLSDLRENKTYESVNKENTTSMYDFMNFTTDSENYNSSASANSIPNIVYPFSIIGVFGLLVSFMFLFICIICPAEENKKHDKTSKDIKTDFRFLAPVVFLCFLLLFVNTGTEIGYAQMLTTYVVKGRLKLPSSTGSFMTSTFWAAFTASRLASVFLAIKFSNLTLIVYDLIITSAGSIVLLFLASYEWAMWLASVLLGVGIASFFPAVVAWLGTYITVTNKIVSTVTVGASFGGMLLPFTISYFIETVPDVLIYVVPAFHVCSILIVIILYLIFRKKQKKNIKDLDCSTVDGSNTIA